MLGRREAWPAVTILGVGLLALGLALKSGQADMPLEPTWILGAVAGFYALLALGLGGASWRWPATFGIMAAGHAVLALLLGWGYAAVGGQALDAYGALVHGLWDYLPGTALQVGFAGVLGTVAAAWLTAPCASVCMIIDGPEPELICLPDLDGLAPAEAVQAACGLPPVGAALVSRGDLIAAAGAWGTDPATSRTRLASLKQVTGSGLETLTWDGATLILRSEEDALAAVLVTAQLPGELAHELLRRLWALLPAAPPPEAE